MKKVLLSFVMLALVFGLAVNAQAKRGETISGTVNINTATVDELVAVPGIGPSKAQAIVDFRATEKFTTVDDLDKVKGIGTKMLETLRPYLTVDGPTNIRVTKNASLTAVTPTVGENR